MTDDLRSSLEHGLDALGAASPSDLSADRFFGAVRRRRRVRIMQKSGVVAAVLLAGVLALSVFIRPAATFNGPLAINPDAGLPALTPASVAMGILNHDATTRTPRIGDVRNPESLAGVLAGI